MTDLSEFLELLYDVRDKVDALVARQNPPEYYSIGRAAELLERSEFTIREWCRLGRIHAEKRQCGRGNTKEWMISHAEIQRYQSEGLLPRPERLHRPK